MEKGKVLNLFNNKKNINNIEVKYSTLIEKFIAPYINSFKEFEYQEDIFDFAIIAWNFGNLKSKIDKHEFKEIISYAKNDAPNYELLKKMISSKVSNFKEFTNFIVDYDLNEKNGILVLTAVTQPEEVYLKEMLEVSKEEYRDDEYQENYINRSAICLKPLKPFIAWHNAIYPDTSIDETDFNDVNIYLIKEIDYEDIETHLKKKFDYYFKMELEGWHTNKKEWPQRRNYKMFKEWFRVDISTLIYDKEKTPISKRIN